jgi:hypothetical protein
MMLTVCQVAEMECVSAPMSVTTWVRRQADGLAGVAESYDRWAPLRMHQQGSGLLREHLDS